MAELLRAEDQIASLARAFDEIVGAAELINTDDEHDPEGATIAFERAQVASLLRQARADRAALVRSLERIDEPGYGVCDICHHFIGVERLMALPAATKCIGCAR